MNFAEAISKTNIIYWEGSKVTWQQVTALLISNAVLLTLSRSACFGFRKLEVNVILALISMLFQYVASIACLFRGAESKIVNDAPKLAFLIRSVKEIGVKLHLLCFMQFFSF